MKTKNKMNWLMLFSFLVVMCAGMAIAETFNLDTPAASGTISSTTYNVSITNNAAANYTQCMVSAVSTLSGNTTTINYANFSTENDSVSQQVVDFSNLYDADDFTITATCTNLTGTSSDTSTSVIIDYTTPTAPSSLTSETFTNDTFQLASTVVDSTTTSCSVTFQGTLPTASLPTCSYSGTLATVSVSGANDGSFGYTITASDGTQTRTSAISYVEVDLDRGGKSPALAQKQAKAFESAQAKAKAQGILNSFGNALKSLGDWLRSLFA